MSRFTALKLLALVMPQCSNWFELAGGEPLYSDSKADPQMLEKQVAYREVSPQQTAVFLREWADALDPQTKN
jgi:hypothetical protein